MTRSTRMAGTDGCRPRTRPGEEDAGPTSPSVQITDAGLMGLTTDINRPKILGCPKSLAAEYRGPMRRCEACDGAGHYEWVDVRLCAVRPEFGVGGPLRVECPECAGRGWLIDSRDETDGEPHPMPRP